MQVGGGKAFATVDDYNEEMELYNLKLLVSGRNRLVSDEEIESVDVAAFL